MSTLPSGTTVAEATRESQGEMMMARTRGAALGLVVLLAVRLLDAPHEIWGLARFAVVGHRKHRSRCGVVADDAGELVGLDLLTIGIGRRMLEEGGGEVGAPTTPEPANATIRSTS